MYTTCCLMVIHPSICQMLYAYVKEQRRACPDTNSCGKISFSNWDQRSRSYGGNECTRHIIPNAKQGKIKEARTQSHVINPKNWHWGQRSTTFRDHEFTRHIHPCSKYGNQMSTQKEVMGQARKHVKNPINLNLRSKVNVVLGSWMHASHPLMVIHLYVPNMVCQCQSEQKVISRTRICTDRQTDR